MSQFDAESGKFVSRNEIVSIIDDTYNKVFLTEQESKELHDKLVAWYKTITRGEKYESMVYAYPLNRTLPISIYEQTIVLSKNSFVADVYAQVSHYKNNKKDKLVVVIKNCPQFLYPIIFTNDGLNSDATIEIRETIEKEN